MSVESRLVIRRWFLEFPWWLKLVQAVAAAHFVGADGFALISPVSMALYSSSVNVKNSEIFLN